MRRQPKVVTAGTHRASSAEATWERVRPLLPEFGITRVADLTWLDDIGIPVFQAVRPKSRALAASQGKGLTRELARVSAVMEGVEGFAAECVPVTRSGLRAAELGLPYDVGDLARSGYESMARSVRLDWTAAVDLMTGASTYVPVDEVSLDWTVRLSWRPPVFASDSNGLASGNTYEEAVLHGLYELLEREALAVGGRETVGAASVTGEHALTLLDRMTASGADVLIESMTNEIGLPAFAAEMIDPSFPTSFGGYGAHLDPDVALCRALSEAVQSRSTVISGARDDISASTYKWSSTDWVARDPGSTITFSEVAERARHRGLVPTSDLVADLAILRDCLRSYSESVLVVDLTPADGVHVVKVVAPGLTPYRGH
ncbi:MAG: YcaO-like family protein [Candidatus Nanopelagicales bacterium]|nr:YcaO-like family protein [Candidatus Nanopelagicales bacterium]